MPIADSLTFVAAPMVNQSDLPFRKLVEKYGATMVYTQMLLPNRLLEDQDYLEFHQRGLMDTAGRTPVVVQLCGNDPENIVRAGKKLQGLCDGIDLNLGCPQESARDGHFGAYLLGQKDWPIVQQIVSSMSNSFTVPTSVKLRLCQPDSKTLELAQKLETCGASWITLHARTVSARRRRQGAADLSQVKILKDGLTVPVVSNGNVRRYEDLAENMTFSGADGLMVGETLLGNPCLFSNTIPDPVDISLEYLALCRDYPATATIATIQTHVRHIVEFQCGRRPWYQKFRIAINQCHTLDDIDILLRRKVERWRGRLLRSSFDDELEEEAAPDDVVDGLFPDLYTA